jgi:YidC/Oxa1 family membrane protein insertase
MNIFQIALIQPLTNGLILFYNLLWQNMGLAIIGFSLFLRFATNPLTKPYMASMKKIKEVEPLVNKLKLKYKNDQKALMSAQTELYKQKGINPTAGCLPYILNIVIMIALFNVFTHVLSINSDSMEKLNNLLYTPLNFSGISFPVPGPFIILAGLLQFLSAKMMAPVIKKEEEIAKKTKGEADDVAVAMQSSMIYTFPLMTIFFGVKFPSGLALYWLLFSVFQMYQQYKSSGWGGLTPLIRKLGLVQ